MAATDSQQAGRRRIRMIAAVLLVIAALGAALGVHRRFVSADKSDAVVRGDDAFDGTMLEGDGSMAELFSGARATAIGEGKDPGGLPPPEGSRMVAADSGKIDGQIIERAQYECGAAVDVIASHYEQLMTRRGFVRTGTTRKPDGSTATVYVSSSGKAIVGLRNPSPDNTIGSIIVMFLRPRGRAE